MPTQKPRISFTLSEETKERVDAFRFDNRIRNQTQAVLALIDIGLQIIETEQFQPRVPTEDIAGDSSERAILKAYRAADDRARSDALSTLLAHPRATEKTGTA